MGQTLFVDHLLLHKHPAPLTGARAAWSPTDWPISSSSNSRRTKIPLSHQVKRRLIQKSKIRVNLDHEPQGSLQEERYF